MSHLANKHPLDSFHWSKIAGQNETQASFGERPKTRIAKPALSRLQATCTALRHNDHSRVTQWIQTLFLASIFSLCAPACFAERADRDKPLLLEADQVLIDDMRQTSTFTGNVRLTQGTMRILGSKVEVLNNKDGFKQAKAYGNTASFRQKREGSEEYVEGYGERIEYDSRTGTVDFYVQARVKRELDEVRGDHITYSMKTETFQVSSSPGSAGTPPQRVRAVLQPRPKADPTAPPTQDALPVTPGKTLTSPE